MLKYYSSIKPISVLLILFFTTSFIITFPREAAAIDYSVYEHPHHWGIYYQIPYYEMTSVHIYMTHQSPDLYSGSLVFCGGTLYGGKISEINPGDSCSNTLPSGGRVLGTIPRFGVSDGARSSQSIIIPPDVEVIYFKYNDTGNGIVYTNPQVHGGSGTCHVVINYVRVSGAGELETIKQAAINAQNAASNAQTAANNTYNQINHSEYGLNALKTKIENINAPIVTQVSTSTGATVSTNGQSPTIIVDAGNATHFNLSLDGINWLGEYPISAGGTIAINPGKNEIKVRAYDKSIPPEKRRYGYGRITIFGL